MQSILWKSRSSRGNEAGFAGLGTRTASLPRLLHPDCIDGENAVALRGSAGIPGVAVLGFLLAVSPGLCASGDAEALAGGATTVFDESREAFSQPAANLPAERRAAFFVGNSFFNQNWVAAPASTVARDGLGPLFNTRSCSACHFKDGRSQPPEAGKPFSTALLRISIPGTGPHGEPRPDPVYGDQIQGNALPEVKPEADVFVDYEIIEGRFADGERYALRRPVYRLTNLGYGPVSADLLMSARVAPTMIGLGLLETIPESTLRDMADPEDRDGDGISGRVNRVWDVGAARAVVGRFGWKAEQPSVRQQTAGAFRGDMGLTSSLMPESNHTAGQMSCEPLPTGGTPEVSDQILDAVVFYSRMLAVPAARNASAPEVIRGRNLFNRLQCAACHRPELVTGERPELPELSRQTIRPYTDLLLHDLGPELADDRPVFEASGREWRTAPLWGLGLVPTVNGHSTLLHDGRARDFAEAILWHGGEAETAREGFRSSSKDERAALIAFLRSL